MKKSLSIGGRAHGEATFNGPKQPSFREVTQNENTTPMRSNSIDGLYNELAAQCNSRDFNNEIVCPVVHLIFFIPHSTSLVPLLPRLTIACTFSYNLL